jgi:hypothetical protein
LIYITSGLLLEQVGILESIHAAYLRAIGMVILIAAAYTMDNG